MLSISVSWESSWGDTTPELVDKSVVKDASD